MKKGTFYILSCGYITEAKTGYIYETARNRYGIDNRGDKLRPVWHISDLVTGCGIGGSFNTRKAAADFITDHIENIILKNQGGTPHADRARETIAAAYQNGAPAAQQPPALKYIIDIYESNGTPRATFKRAAADYPELDIPAAEIDIYKKEITKNNAPGRVDFIEMCPASLAEIVKVARENAAERQERRAAKNPAPTPAERPTAAQRAREEAILYDYIIESRDPAKIKRLLDKTSNNAERFWDDVRSIAGYLSDHAQSRYQILAEALYKIRFTAPTAPAADEAEQTHTESHSAPQSATAPAEEITQEETPKNPQRDAETRATITDGETPAEAAEAPQDAKSALYIVQCRSPRRRWIDYSSPATLEKCEEIKATAEARRTCSNNGELLQYRIIPQEATPAAEAAESPTAAPQRHGSTTGDQQTTNAHREPHRATERATATATTTPPHDRQTAGATTTRGHPDTRKSLFTDPMHIKKIIWYFDTSF